MKQYNCKNCGAPISHVYNHRCEYCGTMFDFRIEKTEEIDPKYMYDVEVREAYYEPWTDRTVIVFEGQYLKYSEALEYCDNSLIAKVSYDSTVPKRTFYCIALEDRLFHFYGDNIGAIFDGFPVFRYPHFREALIKWISGGGHYGIARLR